MTQPSGLPGFRQASTKPTTANGADKNTGTEPPLAARLWWARRASGTSAIIKASTSPPRTSAPVGDASRKRRLAPAVTVAGATPPMKKTLRQDRSGNVTDRTSLVLRPGVPRDRPRGQRGQVGPRLAGPPPLARGLRVKPPTVGAMASVRSRRCVVIGAGVLGASVAARLASADWQVTLLEADQPGRATSRWSFAWLNSNDKAPRPYHDLNHAGIRAWA